MHGKIVPMNIKEFLTPADDTAVYITVSVSTAGVAASKVELTVKGGITAGTKACCWRLPFFFIL